MVLEVIQREVPTRGIGYLILRDCPEERLGEALGKGMEKLKKAGARTVWAASLPEGEPLNDGPVGLWRLTHVHDMVRMEGPAGGREKAGERLAFRAVKRASDDKLFLELVNRSCADVPNARTLGQGDLRLPNHRAVLAFRRDEPVGAWQLDLNEKIPELTVLAVAPELRRQGLGRAVLRNALEGVRSPVCSVTVSTASPAALALFQSEGFVRTGVESSWFEVV